MYYSKQILFAHFASLCSMISSPTSSERNNTSEVEKNQLRQCFFFFDCFFPHHANYAVSLSWLSIDLFYSTNSDTERHRKSLLNELEQRGLKTSPPTTRMQVTSRKCRSATPRTRTSSRPTPIPRCTRGCWESPALIFPS